MPFSDIPHQKVVTGQLAATIRLNRLAHAYLFKGDRCSGKLPTALALAQAVNCQKFEELGDACGQCDSCHRFASMSHPDLFLVKPESKSRRIVIDQILNLNKSVFQKPMMARYKVGIIEDADCMGPEAYNAFLKTLEEPPLNCLLLLLTTRPESLPDTIIARCQKLSFATVISKHLTPLESKSLDFVSTLSADGNLFDLYSGLCNLIGELDEMVKNHKNQLEESLDADKWKDIADKSYFDKVEDETLARLSAFRRLERQSILKIFYLWQRDLLVLKSNPDSRDIHFTQKRGILQSVSASCDEGKLLQATALIEKLMDDLDKTNLPEMLALETACLKLQGK